MSEVEEDWTPPNDPGYSLEGPPSSKTGVVLTIAVVGVVFLFLGTMIAGAVGNRIAEGERYTQFVTYCEKELDGFLLDTGRYEAQCVDGDRRILDVWHP